MPVFLYLIFKFAFFNKPNRKKIPLKHKTKKGRESGLINNPKNLQTHDKNR